jgi:cell division GTPase FtsZ
MVVYTCCFNRYYRTKHMKEEDVDYGWLLPQVTVIGIGFIGQQAAEPLHHNAAWHYVALDHTFDQDVLHHTLQKQEMVIIIANNNNPLDYDVLLKVAKMAHDAGALTVALLTHPLSDCPSVVDVCIETPDTTGTIPIQRAITAISDLILKNGFVCTDFADVTTVLSEPGTARIGFSRDIDGENRADQAITEALDDLHRQQGKIRQARGVLVCIHAGEGYRMAEHELIALRVRALLAENTTLVVGHIVDGVIDAGCLRVTLVVMGMGTTK